jgi:hypothetical protein
MRAILLFAYHTGSRSMLDDRYMQQVIESVSIKVTLLI